MADNQFPISGNVFDVEAIANYVKDKLAEQLNENKSDKLIELASTPLPHVVTFRTHASTLSGVYWPTDEAIKKAWDNARFMKNDLAVMECVEMRRRSVALLEWHVTADNPKDERAREAARIIEKIIRKTPRFLQFRENLLYAIWYGKYGIQMTWGNTLIEGTPRFYISDWLPVNGDKLVYKIRTGKPYEHDRVGIRIGYGASYTRELEWDQIGATENGMAYFLTDEQRDRFIIHRHMVEDGDYDDPYSGGAIYGVGIRSRIYWTWYLMKETLAWLMEYVERSATGFEIWYYPAGNEKAKKSIIEAAENRVGHSGNIVVVPQMEGQNGPSYQMQRIEPSMAGAEVCMSIVKEFFQHQIKRYILGQTLTTESGSTGLGSNLASIHLETYLQIIKYDALNLGETLTELVEKIRKFNFPYLDEGCLRFNIETDEIDHRDRLDSIRSAWDMGARITEKETLSAAGLSEPSDDDRVLYNPAFQVLQQGQQGQVEGQDELNEDEGTGQESPDSEHDGLGKNPQFRGVRGVRERPGLRGAHPGTPNGANPVLQPKGAAASRRQVEQAY